jgi:hypothetical protein
MEFIETPIFTRMILDLLDNEAYRRLQNLIPENPGSGAVIRGGGGIRKLRFALQGTGKSGGIRVIYYWSRERNQIYLLIAYPKSKKDSLSERETAILRDLVKEL